MKAKKISVLFCLFLLSFTWSALAQKVSGKIWDEQSGAPVAYATIFLDQNHKTISNESGDFDLELSRFPVEIVVSHISYQPIKLQLNDTKLLNIKLKPVVQTLSEVTVGNYGLSLMSHAYEKAKNYVEDAHYARSFFRQVAYEADRPTYLNEIYFDSGWKSYGLLEWKPTQTRNLKSSSNVSYTNLSFTAFIASGNVTNNMILKPLFSKLDSFYTFQVKKTFNTGDDEVAVVNCKLKIKTTKPYFEGDYYINTETFEVLKLEGTIKNFNLTSKGLMGIKLKEINLISQYRINDEGITVLDFSNLTLKSKLTVMGMGTKETELSIYMIDYKKEYNIDLKPIQAQTNDVKTAQEGAHDPQFWKEHPTIKRTSREEDAIRVLEESPQVKK